MVNEKSSDIVMEMRTTVTTSGEPVELLIFANRLTLAVSPGALALYRDPECFADPLGNGLWGSAEIPAEGRLKEVSGRLVSDIKSGCVNLMDDKVLLILPNEARLYRDRASALHNREPLVSMALARDGQQA